jgi:hypothetical protein
MRPGIVLGAVGVALIACGSSGNSTTSSSSAAAAVCTAKQQIQASLNTISGMTVQTATVGQLRTELGKIADSLQTLRSERSSLSASRLDDLNTAVTSLKSTVDGDIPTGTPLTQVQAAFATETSAVRAAWNQLFTGVQC